MFQFGGRPAIVEFVDMDSASRAPSVDHECILNQRLGEIVGASTFCGWGVSRGVNVSGRSTSAAGEEQVKEHYERQDATGLQVPGLLTLIHPGVLEGLGHRRIRRTGTCSSSLCFLKGIPRSVVGGSGRGVTRMSQGKATGDRTATRGGTERNVGPNSRPIFRGLGH